MCNKITSEFIALIGSCVFSKYEHFYLKNTYFLINNKIIYVSYKLFDRGNLMNSYTHTVCKSL